MNGLTVDQQTALDEIAESMRETGYGRYWPDEYKNFSHAWGYFNSIYNLLYSDLEEWKRIARLSLDVRFAHIWHVVRKLKSTRELAKLPCVGDGRDTFNPADHVQIAFNTLRADYGLSIKTPCRRSKCKIRRQASWNTCLNRVWPMSPILAIQPDQAKFTPLGASLLIIYQIRNNLFHGAKREIHGAEYERNKLLVKLGLETLESILHGIEALI
jgi:hypothetical protein